MHGLGDTPAGFTDLFGSIEYSPFLKSTRVVLPCEINIGISLFY